MPPKAFSPGFRFSMRDAIVLLAAAVAGTSIGLREPRLGLLIFVVVLHFFLFCNVFRLSRPRELAWTGVFLTVTGSMVIRGAPTWPVWFFTVLVATTAVLALEMRRPSYHGVFWRVVNPNLPAWWEARQE